MLCAPLGPCRAQGSSRWSGASGRPLIIDFLDIGQGDSILIRSPEGKTALVDAGPSKDAATQALKRKHIESLDIVIVSHHHSDHYGGMDQVIRNFKPKYFMATGSPHTTKMYLKLLQTVKDEGITSVQPTAKPRRIELGTVILTIFPQPPEMPDEENNNSIGLRLEYGDFVAVMTGDSEEDERKWWMSHNPDLLRDCTILKLAHHGSRNGTDQRLAGPAPARGRRREPGRGERLRPPPLRDRLAATKERDPAAPHRPAGHGHRRERRPDLEPRRPAARAAPPASRGRRGGGRHRGRGRREIRPLVILPVAQPAEMMPSAARRTPDPSLPLNTTRHKTLSRL